MRQVEILITKKNTVTTAYYYWIHLIAKYLFLFYNYKPSTNLKKTAEEPTEMVWCWGQGLD